MGAGCPLDPGRRHRNVVSVERQGGARWLVLNCGDGLRNARVLLRQTCQLGTQRWALGQLECAGELTGKAGRRRVELPPAKDNRIALADVEAEFMLERTLHIVAVRNIGRPGC